MGKFSFQHELLTGKDPACQKEYGYTFDNMSEFIDNADDINGNAFNSKDLTYLPQVVVLNGSFPHSKTDSDYAETRTSETKNTKVSVTIESGYNEQNEPFGIPTGYLPRIMLAFIMSQAKKQQNKFLAGKISRKESLVISLGSNIREICRNIGVADSGGITGRRPFVKKELMKLLHCHTKYTVTINKNGKTRKKTYTMSIASSTDIEWLNDAPESFSSKIVLTQEFCDTMLKNPFPFNFEILKLLRSSLDFDVYVLLSVELPSLNNDKFVSFESLYSKHGHGYSSTKRFIEKIKQSINRIKIAYPEGRVEIIDGTRSKKGGIILRKSVAHVPRQLILFGGKK